MLHEKREELSEETLNLKRAIDSLKEELEAVDWYRQRADVCKNKALKDILVHNMNEEKEHAAMLIEWIRQNDTEFANEVDDYLNADTEDIAGLE